MVVLGGIYLSVLVKRPDYNPFFVFQIYRNLRSITTLESLNGEIRDIYEESSVYPADKGVLLGIVRQKKPKLASAVAGIPFVYQSNGDSYLLYWAAGRPSNARGVFLVHNDDYFFTLERFVEKEMIPAYQIQGVTPDPTASDDSVDSG